MNKKKYLLSLLDYNIWANDEFFKVIINSLIMKLLNNVNLL